MKIDKLPSYGGQALIEGVMMRGAHSVAAAMRAPKGQIIIQSEELSGIYKSGLKNIPFLRGLLILWDALGLGIRFLTISANLQSGQDEKIEGLELYLTLGGSLVIGIALFFIFPAAIGHLIEQLLGLTAWFGNLIEGFVRLTMIICYIWLIGKIPDVEQVFAYHGAEHKTINAFESGVELKPENVMRFSVEHPRCGTAFLLTVVVLSIFMFSMLGPMPIVWRLLSRVIMLPVLVGISYEYIRWTGNHLESPLIQFLTRPNLALQSMTTREPTLDMIEVSIAAFNKMRSSEEAI